MICKKCGEQLKDNAMFCSECGASITDTEQHTNKEMSKAKKNKIWIFVLAAVVTIIIVAIAIINISVTNSVNSIVEQESNINIANKLAEKIEFQTVSFMTKMDASKKTFTCAEETIVTATVTNGVWKMIDTAGTFGDGSINHWSCIDYYSFEYNMTDCLSDFKNGYVEITLGNGGCVYGVAVIIGTGNYEIDISPDDWRFGEYDFTGGKDGLMADGTIIGTYPRLLSLDR